MFGPPPFMTTAGLKAKVGSFNSGTGAAASTVAVTGVGFTPKAVILWWSGRTGTSDAVGGGNILTGRGFATSSTQRNCVGNQSLDGDTEGDTHFQIRNDACVFFPTTTGAVDGLLDFQSFDADGFTLVVDDQFSASIRIHYLALGGANLTAKAGIVSAAASTGNQDFTDPGFTPSAVLLNINTTNNANTLTSSGAVGIGLITAASQAIVFGQAENVADPTNTFAYARVGDEAWAYSNTFTDINRRGSGSIITNGFRINVLEAPGGAVQIPYLALGGCLAAVGSVQTRTDGNNIVVSSLGMRPKAALFLSHCRAQDAADTLSDGFEFSMGAASGASDRAAIALLDRDNQANTQTATAVEHDAVYANISTADAIEGLMDLVSFDNDGMTLVMDDADPSAAMVVYLALG